jgi:hypothetical protein
VFAAVLSPDQVAALHRVEAGKRPADAHDVLSVAWLQEVDAAGDFVDIM